MSEYALTVGVDRDEYGGSISYEDRDELFDELSELVEEEPETEHPPRHLSAPTFEAVLTVGTIVLSNPDQIALLYKTLKDMPQFSIEGVAARIDNKFVFEAPEEVNIDVDVNILSKHESTVLYQSEEKSEFKKQRERERLIEKINEGQPEGEEYTVESFEEEYGEFED